MKRTVRRISVGDGTFRNKVTIYSEFCNEENRHDTKLPFLRELFNEGAYTGMLATGMVPFEKMRLFFENNYWVLILEAEENIDE